MQSGFCAVSGWCSASLQLVLARQRKGRRQGPIEWAHRNRCAHDLRRSGFAGGVTHLAKATWNSNFRSGSCQPTSSRLLSYAADDRAARPTEFNLAVE